MNHQEKLPDRKGWTRREFVCSALAGAALGLSGIWAWRRFFPEGLPWPFYRETPAEAFIARAPRYHMDLTSLILSSLKELGVTPQEIRGKRILLKPNLVETRPGAEHINTHPLVVRAAVEAFLHLGAARVLVAEGVGHRRDSLMVLEESGLAEVLFEDRIRFIDLNVDSVFTVPNQNRATRMATLTFPNTLKQVDWVVSMAKMKTHHWAGATLSMKNLFGVMPGSYYGWPKNVLHLAGIEGSIVDIAMALKPQLAIVDGIIGMEGDGPIMGTPKPAGVLVLGRNLPAVDATCARIMGINPHRLGYLAAAAGRLGPIREANIRQLGETIAAVQTPFALIDAIPAHQGIRL
ncbi:MAG: DUF362 domain-containing protein [Desulfobaccales bacterium]